MRKLGGTKWNKKNPYKKQAKDIEGQSENKSIGGENKLQH